MPYKSSRRSRPKAKQIGRFEVGAFCLVIGFAVGLTCGLLMGGIGSSFGGGSSVERRVSVSPGSSVDDFRVERLEASMNRLKESGADVEVLKDRYLPEESSRVETLRGLLEEDYGAISLDDL